MSGVRYEWCFSRPRHFASVTLTGQTSALEVVLSPDFRRYQEGYSTMCVTDCKAEDRNRSVVVIGLRHKARGLAVKSQERAQSRGLGSQ
jgi:hypothetical protein